MWRCGLYWATASSWHGAGGCPAAAYVRFGPFADDGRRIIDVQDQDKRTIDVELDGPGGRTLLLRLHAVNYIHPDFEPLSPPDVRYPTAE